MITLLHEEAAAELRAPLTELDYRSADRMLMVLRGTPPPDTSGIEVHAIARGSLEVHREATLSEHPQWSSEVGRQMISRDMIVATVVPERCYAVLDNGGIVARCQVYGNGAIAQIEHVYTLAAHRGRGYARALVTFAAREARAMGASEVFLVAETEDWPRQFYGRLGFADAGLMPRFLRLLK
jgi:GNAT superfamily N-acetyltransferase